MAGKGTRKIAGATQKSAGRQGGVTGGRSAGPSAATEHPRTTLTEQTRSSGRAGVTSWREPRVASQAAAAGPSARRRATPADDPLAPERTRWLADVVGGGGKLAAMLGVNASQTSRWAKGDERPGPQVAPLLIDLEHVLARVRLVWSEPAATVWMTSANARLDGARPADVLALRGVGPVLEALDAGAWGGAA